MPRRIRRDPLFVIDVKVNGESKQLEIIASDSREAILRAASQIVTMYPGVTYTCSIAETRYR